MTTSDDSSFADLITGLRATSPDRIVHVWELFADWDAQIAAAVGHIDAAFAES